MSPESQQFFELLRQSAESCGPVAAAAMNDLLWQVRLSGIVFTGLNLLVIASAFFSVNYAKNAYSNSEDEHWDESPTLNLFRCLFGTVYGVFAFATGLVMLYGSLLAAIAPTLWLIQQIT